MRIFLSLYISLLFFILPFNSAYSCSGMRGNRSLVKVAKFEPLKAIKSRILNAFQRKQEPTHSIYPFSNLWVFKAALDPQLAEVQDGALLHLAGARPYDRNILLEPLGGDSKERAEKIAILLKEHPTSNEKPNTVLYVSEEVANHLKDRPDLIVKEIPEKSEYIYESRDLATLVPPKLENQRKSVWKFFSSPNTSKYIELDKLSFPDWAVLVPSIKDFLKEWSKDRKGNDRKDFQEEMQATVRMIDNFRRLNFKGGLLLINGKIVGLTIGKQLNSNTHVVYSEKALTEFNGTKIEAYKAINQKFAMATVKDSLRENNSEIAQNTLHLIESLEGLEQLINLPHDKQLEIVSQLPILHPESMDLLTPLSVALRQSRGLDLQKALENSELMKTWESIKLHELAMQVNKGKIEKNTLMDVIKLLRAKIFLDLEKVQSPFVKYINRQEDGGEIGHRIPKMRLNPIADKGKVFAIQSKEVPELDWNIYEIDR